MQDNVTSEKKTQKLRGEIAELKEKIANFKNECISYKKILKKRDALFNELPAGVMLIQDGKVIEINDTLLKQLGYKMGEVIGRDYLDFIRADQKEYVKGLHGTRISGKISQNQYDVNLLKKNGQTIFSQVTFKPIRYNNRKAFLLDLTDLKNIRTREKEKIHCR